MQAWATASLSPPPTPAAAAAAPIATSTAAAPWRRLGVSRSQLCLHFTLPTGQSFRWRKTGDEEYTGVIGRRVVQLVQEEDDVAWRVIARSGADGLETCNSPGAAAAPAQDAEPDAGAEAGADAAALADYFNLGVDLAALYEEWAAADARFAKLAPHIPGARMLRQDPLECLFQFICSQNNHISRIHGMVERLCAAYGTPLLAIDGGTAASAATPEALVRHYHHHQQQQQQQVVFAGNKRPLQEGPASPGDALQLLDVGTPAAGLDGSWSGSGCVEAALENSPPPSTPHAVRRGGADGRSPSRPSKRGRRRVAGGADGNAAPLAAAPPALVEAAVLAASEAAPSVYYAFPTLEQLCAATEEDLRAMGFGYRAKFITGASAALRGREGGGEAWLMGLRGVPAAEAAAALEELPGVGPKVAACVALFSLDKHDAIPVDTHVWQLATKYYAPHLAGKSLTKKLHAEVAAAFTGRFGGFAGWAHSVLFISDLRQTRGMLADAQAAAGRARKATTKGKAALEAAV